MTDFSPQYLDSSLEDIALTHWQNGELVVIPTETVYGLAADASNDQAVAKIYALKHRPSFNPLIAHVDGTRMASRYVAWNEVAETLATAFWPGPLTLVLPLLPDAPISALATDGGETLGVRAPNHGHTLSLITRFGKPVVAPSANQSGRVSPSCADHVRQEFGSACPLIIDGGACRVGIESTVLDITTATPTLLRHGAITQAMIEKALNTTIALYAPDGTSTLKSPGLLLKHYAPSTPLRLNTTKVNEGEALLAFGDPIPEGAQHVFNLSASGNLQEAATRLFAGLRYLDACGATSIAVMPVPKNDIGIAINDRLMRAASKA